MSIAALVRQLKDNGLNVHVDHNERPGGGWITYSFPRAFEVKVFDNGGVMWVRTPDAPDDVRGGNPPSSSSSWQKTRRSATCSDGVKRVLYRNPAKHGELRVRKMVTRAGKRVATYVKP